MIDSYKKYRDTIRKESEYYIRTKNPLLKFFRLTWFKPPIFKFIVCLRYLEYLKNTRTVPFRLFRIRYAMYKWEKISIKLGYTIYPNCFDTGLKIGHYGGIIVNENCKIGKNCSIRPFTVIGNKKNSVNNRCPVIGDNVTIGANVVIIGDIRIGNGVVIGAGAVVTKSIPANSIVVGNPAKIIN